MKNQQGLRGAYRLLGIQLSITLALASIFMVASGWVCAFSALLGGCVCAIPHAFFAQYLFQDIRASLYPKVARRVYQGEALKIVISILCFILIFYYLNIVPSVFFGVYFVAQLTCWFAPLMFVKR